MTKNTDTLKSWLASIGVAAAATVVTTFAGTANAEWWSSDTAVTASAGQTSTDWVDMNPYKPGAMEYAPTATNACFLTTIGGDFNGWGEVAWVYQDRGYWALGAASKSGNGVTAGASCVAIPDVSYQSPAPTTAAYSWLDTMTIPTTISLPAPHPGYLWSCYLTRVGGKFQGSGEMVEVYGSGTTWYLDGGRHTGGGFGIMAQARCVQTRTISKTYELSQNGDYDIELGEAGGVNSSGYPISNPAYYPTRQNNCFLKRMRGRFEGAGEKLWVVFDGQSHTPGWPNHWRLQLASQQSGVAGAFQCPL